MIFVFLVMAMVVCCGITGKDGKTKQFIKTVGQIVQTKGLGCTITTNNRFR
jgi:hypothetical protein